MTCVTAPPLLPSINKGSAVGEAMESLGKCLRSERELKGLSLEEVAGVLEIKEWYLFAIEENSFELLPSGGYDRRFLAAYAKYLGLDQKEVIQRYDGYCGRISVPEPLENQQAQSPKRKIGKWLFVTPLVALFIFIAFTYRIMSEHPESLPPVQEKKALKPTSPSYLSPLKIEGQGESFPIPLTEREKRSRLQNIEATEGSDTEPSPFEVIKAGTGMGIGREGRRLILVGEASEFPCSNRRVYFFTRIQTPRERDILHVWFREDKEYRRLIIKVRPPAWSVYSYISLRPGLAGNWRAEVRDGDKILSKAPFRAIEASSS